MSEDEYSGKEIIKNHWPEWLPVNDGGVARHWVFEFELAPEKDEILSAELGDDDLHVIVTSGTSPHELHVVASTIKNAWSDDIFLALFTDCLSDWRRNSGDCD